MSRRSRRRHEEHESHERWLVSYADFITLLFAFFVVLYATSNNDPEKQQKFEESVRAEMKLAVVGAGGKGGAGNGAGGPDIIAQLMNPINDQFPRRGSPAEVEDFIERQLKRRMTKDEQEKAGIEVTHDNIGARISLNAAKFFPVGETKIKVTSLPALNEIADILKQTDRKVVIEGHTDDREIGGSLTQSNWELASLRATSVVRYFIKHQGIAANRMGAMSYADQHPVAPNDTEENRAKNRRVEILVTTEQVE